MTATTTPTEELPTDDLLEDLDRFERRLQAQSAVDARAAIRSARAAWANSRTTTITTS